MQQKFTIEQSDRKLALAIFILAHKNTAQVLQLFQSIHHTDDLFILHIDRRAEAPLHELVRELCRRHPNVVALPSRAIFWGGPGIVDVQREAMALALVRSSSWQNFLTLSGQDFPLKTREQIVARLTERPGASYLSWFDPLQEPLWSNARERLSKYYFESPSLEAFLKTPFIGRRVRAALGWSHSFPHVPFLRREWPSFFRYFGGSNHVNLSREAVEYITHAPEAKRIGDWLRHAALSDEIVYQSILLNSPLAEKIENDSLREIDFPLHSPNPRIFTMNDLPRLQQSPALFARKFDAAVDAGILDELSRSLLKQ